MARRKRRGFTEEYKAEVVELIRTSGRSIGAIAKELDLSVTTVRPWAQQAVVDAGRGGTDALTMAERDGRQKLRLKIRAAWEEVQDSGSRTRREA